MKFFAFTILLFIIMLNKVYSVSNINQIDLPEDKSITQLKPGDVAFKIYIPGKKNIDGKIELGKVYSIPVLPEGEYLPGTIHIKTKKYFPLKSKNDEISKLINKSLNSDEIVKINAPFDRFASKSLKVYDKEGISRIYELTYSSEKNPYDLCKELMKNPEIEYAVPIFMRYYHDFTPNDPELSKQWAISKMQSVKSWDISKGDSTVIIAITDSGTEYLHEDLAPNMWVNINEIPNDKIDNDSNGFVDDYLGWDFVGSITASQAVSGSWKPDNDPKPGHYHGTHVAGCAAAAGNNGKGVCGPGFQCKIMALKCGIDASNSTGIFRGYDAILYAAQMGADIINCSWGGPGNSPAEQDLINAAFNLGSVIVVSAGNSFKNIDYGNSFPACYDNVLCVGATRSNDQKAWFSNYGHLVDVYGPGDNIYSTMPGINKYGYQSGTSMSAPVVSGVCGQLKAIHPNWSPKQIMHQIRSTSENVITTNTALRPLYYGRVNAYNAVSYNNPNLGVYEKIPGISVSKILSEGVDVLTDYNPATFRLEITNYLSKAYRTKLKITPLQKYLSVSVSQVDIGVIDAMASDTISLVIRLLESTPWYEGKVDILLEYTSDTYTDYEIIQLPLKLETNNKFALNYIFPETDLPLWYSALSTGTNNIMMVGARQLTGNGIFYKNTFGYNPVALTQNPLYCLYSNGDNVLFAGSGGSPTDIIKSTDEGSSWTKLDVSNITNFINAIYFFDNLEGVFAGDPVGGSWGVAITSNGGQNWTRSTKTPSLISGEAGYAGCASGYGNNFWFGTNKGRVILTKDRAKNWQSVTIKSNGFIHRILFFDGLIGFAVYTNSSTDAEKKLAVTWDGGTTWELDKFNFGKTLGVNPIYLYQPGGAEIIVALCSGGEIYYSKDFGKTWLPVLTYKFSTASFGAAYGANGTCRMWSGETELTYLDFEYIPKNPRKTLDISPSGTIAFGDVDANKAKTITVTMKNTGNMNIRIDSTKIIIPTGVYEDEYKITFPLSDVIAVDETKTTRIKFTPLKEGIRRAEFFIYSNADIPVLKANLTGTGINALEEISFINDTIVDFDTVEIGQVASYNLKYKNTGNIIFNINGVTIEADGSQSEFSIPEFTPYEIYPNTLSEISLSFKPKEEGLKEAALRINSDAGDAVMPIKALAVKPVTVENSDLPFTRIGEPLPNPCISEFKFNLDADFNTHAVIRICNSIGEELRTFTKQIMQGSNTINITGLDFANGVYVMKVEIKNQILSKMFIIYR